MEDKNIKKKGCSQSNCKQSPTLNQGSTPILSIRSKEKKKRNKK